MVGRPIFATGDVGFAIRSASGAVGSTFCSAGRAVGTSRLASHAFDVPIRGAVEIPEHGPEPWRFSRVAGALELLAPQCSVPICSSALAQCGALARHGALTQHGSILSSGRTTAIPIGAEHATRECSAPIHARMAVRCEPELGESLLRGPGVAGGEHFQDRE